VSPSHSAPESAASATSAEAHTLLAAACERLGLQLRSHRLRSIHQRGSRSVSHVHEAAVVADGRRSDVLLVTHVDTRGLPGDALVVEHAGLRAAVWRFPHDPYLPGLAAALDQERISGLLDELGLADAGRPVGMRTRAYRPSRRAVVEVTATQDPAQPLLYLKILAGDRATELAATHRQLVDHVPVPVVLGTETVADGVLALSALRGRTLREALRTGQDLPAPDAVVDLSQRLSSSGLRSRRDPVAFADPRRHAARLRELVPDAGRTVDRVAAEASRAGGPTSVVHGDLHAGQLLVEDGRVTGLLDVDNAGTGLLAHDAGSLVAYLQVLAELHPGQQDRVAAYAAAVADAYAQLVGPRDLARAVAGAWLAIATSAHRSQQQHWQATTRSRIDRAAAALDAPGWHAGA
jgi:hypothetical protein